MGFKKYNQRYQKGVAYINIGVNNIGMSSIAFEKLGKPQRVSILFDADTNSIKLLPDIHGVLIHTAPRQYFIGARMWRVMPLGRYYLTNNLVFKKEIKEKEILWSNMEEHQ